MDEVHVAGNQPAIPAVFATMATVDDRLGRLHSGSAPARGDQVRSPPPPSSAAPLAPTTRFCCERARCPPPPPELRAWSVERREGEAEAGDQGDPHTLPSRRLEQSSPAGPSGVAPPRPAKMAAAPAPPALYHMAEVARWRDFQTRGEPYLPPTFEQDGGFVHLTSDPALLLAVANHFYTSAPGDWAVLVLDPAKLTAEVCAWVLGGGNKLMS